MIPKYGSKSKFIFYEPLSIFLSFQIAAAHSSTQYLLSVPFPIAPPALDVYLLMFLVSCMKVGFSWLFLKLSISVKHGRGWAVLLKGRLLLSWTEACWPSLTRKADTVQRAAGNGCRRLLAASQWSADTSILHKWQKEEPSKKGLIHFLRKICTVGKHKLFSL